MRLPSLFLIFSFLSFFTIIFPNAENIPFASENITDSTVASSKPRYALVIALAGSKKLTEYFSWSCRTIYDSRDRFDLLVFHENNQLLRNVTCAENVKFYNLGEKGLSTEIAKTVMNTEDVSNEASQQLMKVIDSIFQHIPTYLSEFKPMMGALFGRYLSSYSYWSYSDPDMIFGSLTQWIDDNDLQQYHYYSLARHWDAARLYLRSQFTLHRNIPEVNFLWQRLTYFESQEFASRVGGILRAITEALEDKHRKSAPPYEAIARRLFHNPEGWYSKLVFENGPGKIKIVGRVFDDFFREPVIRIKTAEISSSNSRATLLRCQQAMNISHCIDHYYMKLKDPEEENRMKSLFGAKELPSPVMKEAEVHIDQPDACKMAWLPIATRSCIASETFHHGSNHESRAAGKAGNTEHHDVLRLSRVGECVLNTPSGLLQERIWTCNNEKESPRQVHEAAAYFHFHHWDEYVAMSKSASNLNEDTQESNILPSKVQDHAMDEHHTHVTADCLVLYLRYDRALVLESCATAKHRESLLWSMTKTRLLLQHFVPASTILKHQKANPVPVADSLSLWRHKIEVGSSAKEDGESEEDLLRRENRRNKKRVMKERERRQQKHGRKRGDSRQELLSQLSVDK